MLVRRVGLPLRPVVAEGDHLVARGLGEVHGRDLRPRERLKLRVGASLLGDALCLVGGLLGLRRGGTCRLGCLRHLANLGHDLSDGLRDVARGCGAPQRDPLGLGVHARARLDVVHVPLGEVAVVGGYVDGESVHRQRLVCRAVEHEHERTVALDPGVEARDAVRLHGLASYSVVFWLAMRTSRPPAR